MTSRSDIHGGIQAAMNQIPERAIPGLLRNSEIHAKAIAKYIAVSTPQSLEAIAIKKIMEEGKRDEANN